MKQRRSEKQGSTPARPLMANDLAPFVERYLKELEEYQDALEHYENLKGKSDDWQRQNGSATDPMSQLFEAAVVLAEERVDHSRVEVHKLTEVVALAVELVGKSAEPLRELRRWSVSGKVPPAKSIIVEVAPLLKSGARMPTTTTAPEGEYSVAMTKKEMAVRLGNLGRRAFNTFTKSHPLERMGRELFRMRVDGLDAPTRAKLMRSTS